MVGSGAFLTSVITSPKMISLILFSVLGLIACSPCKYHNEDEIVGGEEIDIREAPHQASIMMNGTHFCGGTVVDTNVIITASHCLRDINSADFLSIRVGSSSCTDGGEIHNVSKFLMHPNYSSVTKDYDVGIIWLSDPISYSDVVRAIDMASVGEEIPDGDCTSITGYGNTAEDINIPSNLRRVQVPKMNQDECQADYQIPITPRMFCAGLKEGGKDACQGDSGGPLVYNSKLYGVVSWGRGCARPNTPGVYCKVSAVRQWIDENIQLMKIFNMTKKY